MSDQETTAPTGTNAIETVANLLKDADKPAEAVVESVTVTKREAEDDTDKDETLGEGGKKALKAEREARTAAERQAAEFKAELDRIRAANMSDLERAQLEAKNAQEAADRATADALRFRIATQHGISEEDAELFLTGSDADTLAKQAERLKARTATPTAPRPDLSQGAQQAPALNSDALTEALARAVGR